MTFSTEFKCTTALLALALLIGGAGLSFPLLQLALGTAAIMVAAYFIVSGPRHNAGSLDVWARVLLCLVLILPLLQLIPLPPAIWTRLPGREVATQVDAILGLKVYRPWTLDVESTIRSWLVLVPAAVVFVGCLRASAKERLTLLWLVLGFAVANAMLGIVQLVSDGWATPYPSTHSGHPVGFFVNRNHSAAVMLATMPIAAALGSARRRGGKARLDSVIAALSIIAILAILIIGTTSRAGLLLLPISLFVSLFLLFRHQSPLRSTLPMLGVIFAVGFVLVTSSGFDHVLGRFAAGDDPRFAYWENLQWALQHYGWAGTGVGTFVPVFQSAEGLEGVVPQIINHAHNDFLEVLLETGLPSVLILAAFLILTVVAIARSNSSAENDAMTPHRLAAATGVALLLAYSLVDYPLRMPAVAALFAVLYAFLLPVGPAAGRADIQGLADKRATGLGGLSSAPRVARIAGVAALVAVWGLMLQAGMSARAIQDKRFGDGAHWAFWSAKAKEGEATQELGKSQLGAAWRHSLQSLRLSPIGAPAIRNLALIRIIEGKRDGLHLMWIAAGLGWRDVATQLWTIDAAGRTKNYEVAYQRAEGLFRQRKYTGPALQLLLHTSDKDAVSRLLGKAMAQRPYWRSDVLEAAGRLSAADFAAFEQAMFQLAAADASTTSGEMRPMLDQMIARGRAAQAQRLWATLNPALVENGDFSRKGNSGEDARRPLGWDVAPQIRQAITVETLEPGRKERALRVAQTEWITLISQDVMLPAGTYGLAFDARELGPRPVTLRWLMHCKGGPETQSGDVEVPVGQGWKRYSLAFAVPEGDCVIQRLALKRVKADNDSETWLKRIALRPSRD